ncbi:MAG: hypothetical protein ACT4N2_14155 [Hyphomicrobium sp.]
MASTSDAGSEEVAGGISGRIRLAEALEKGVEFETAGNTIEALRMLARVMNLSASLADLDRPRGSSAPQPLDRMTKALYARVERIGTSDRNALPPLGLKAGEQLIYRSLFADGTKLTAFELAGDPKLPKVEWRETPFAPTSPGLAQSIASLTKRAAAAKSNLPVFALILPPSQAPTTLRDEQAMAVTASELGGEGILLAASPSPVSHRPLTLMPALPAAGKDMPPASAVLIYQATNSRLREWSAADKSVADIVAAARAATAEVSADLGLPPPQPLDIGALLDRPMVITAREGVPTAYKAVMEDRKAALVDSDKVQALTRHYALQPVSAMGPWGQFSVYGQKDIVWLPMDAVGPYVEFPDSLRPAQGISLSKFFETATDAEPRQVRRSGARLLAMPSALAETLINIAGGSDLKVLHTQADADGKNRWAFVQLEDRFGWIAENALAAQPKPEAASSDTARPSFKREVEQPRRSPE